MSLRQTWNHQSRTLPPTISDWTRETSEPPSCNTDTFSEERINDYRLSLHTTGSFNQRVERKYISEALCRCVGAWRWLPCWAMENLTGTKTLIGDSIWHYTPIHRWLVAIYIYIYIYIHCCIHRFSNILAFVMKPIMFSVWWVTGEDEFVTPAGWLLGRLLGWLLGWLLGCKQWITDWQRTSFHYTMMTKKIQTSCMISEFFVQEIKCKNVNPNKLENSRFKLIFKISGVPSKPLTKIF